MHGSLGTRLDFTGEGRGMHGSLGTRLDFMGEGRGMHGSLGTRLDFMGHVEGRGMHGSLRREEAKKLWLHKLQLITQSMLSQRLNPVFVVLPSKCQVYVDERLFANIQERTNFLQPQY